MRELSLHILDVAKNSTAAGATLVTVELKVNREADVLSFSITDNGKGMTKEFLARVLDPFTTTRTTRKVGMGLPLLKMAAEAAGGKLAIESEPGVGTTLTAAFGLHHIDRMPLGDFSGTAVALITGDPEIDFVFTVTVDGESFSLDTREVKAEMEGIPLDSPEVAEFMRSYISENLTSLYGGYIE